MDLSNMFLRAIPSWVLQMTQMSELDISENRFLTEIPESVLMMTSLKKILHKNTPIESPPPRVLNQGIDAMRTYCTNRSANSNDDTITHLVDNAEEIVTVQKFLNRIGRDLRIDENTVGTIFHLACAEGEWKVANDLMKKRNVNVDIVNDRGETALHIACLHGRVTAFESLIDMGASLHTLTHDNDTLLHKAAAGGHVALMRALIQRHFLPPTATNQCGETPLHHACRHGRYDASQFLLDSSVNPDEIDQFGGTALHIATDAGHLKLCRLLLEDYKAQGGIADIDGNTPLHRCCIQGNMEVVELLLQRRVPSAATRNKEGLLPLQCLMRSDNHSTHPKITERLMETTMSHLSVVVKAADPPDSITRVDLSWCGIRSLPMWVYSLQYVEELNISHNANLTSVNKDLMQNMKNLQRLICDDTPLQLHTLPPHSLHAQAQGQDQAPTPT
eukprot:GFYU01017256.1.p1 GENE.GFYU01017256.1~~GFYU01017256.1.p1  ORF type:complete len:446 (-),score=87.76 GFYU01017256.1:119-1456(-)